MKQLILDKTTWKTEGDVYDCSFWLSEHLLARKKLRRGQRQHRRWTNQRRRVPCSARDPQLWLAGSGRQANGCQLREIDSCIAARGTPIEIEVQNSH